MPTTSPPPPAPAPTATSTWIHHAANPDLHPDDTEESLMRYLESQDSAYRERVRRDGNACGMKEWEIVLLVRTAGRAREGGYAPYSNFQVGAAALTYTGKIITGANVENASYPVGTCAERCCLSKAVADGHRNFKAMAVATNGVPAASPCGMCRQFMKEFCPPEMPVFMLDRDGRYALMTMEHLLPMGFGPENLKKGKG